MAMPSDRVQPVDNLPREKGLLRLRDHTTGGIPHQYFRMAHGRGSVERDAQGPCPAKAPIAYIAEGVPEPSTGSLPALILGDSLATRR